MGFNLSKRLWIVLGLGVLLAGVLLYLNSRRPVPQVTVVQVQRKDLSSAISSNGKVEPITPYSLRAKFDGFVTQVPVAENQTVKAGQLLLTLDSMDIQAQLDQTQAQLTAEQDDLHAAESGGRSDQAARATDELRAAEAQRDLLAKQQDTLTKLVAQNAATPDELNKNGTALDRANADVDQLRKAKQQFEHQAGLDRARLGLSVAHLKDQIAVLDEKLDSAKVISPVAGALVSLPVHVRDFVHTGDLLAEVADLRQVRVRAYIDEPELGQLEPDQPVEITWDALPGRTWTGHTESVPRQVVARGSRNVGEVLCSITNDQMELIPNTTVDVRILLRSRKEVLTVPRGAVEIDGPRRIVYRVVDGRLHRTEIKVGIADATDYELISGLNEGDVLALPGATPLRDDRAVNVISTE